MVIRDCDAARACLAAGSNAMALLDTLQSCVRPPCRPPCRARGEGVSNSSVQRALRSGKLTWRAKPAQLHQAEGCNERGLGARETHLPGPRHLVRVRVVLPDRGRCQEGASLCVPTPEDESSWFQNNHSATWKGVIAVTSKQAEPLKGGSSEGRLGEADVGGKPSLSKRDVPSCRRLLGYITSAQTKCSFTGTGAVGFCFVEPLADLWSRQFISGAQGREGIFVLMCSPQSTFQRPALVQLCPMNFS
mmetsp:Transcript_42431/g.81079  ORF Transcript_42431/g.81079 Transcript_42431/m.81079 type:complete len:247 (+) Transcript_42431:925-1665(+)